MSPEPPVALVVGSGGLVGRHVVGALRGTGHDVRTVAVPWQDEEASVRVLTHELVTRADEAAGRPLVVAWCAGAGVVATAQHALDSELRVFGRALDALEHGGGDRSATTFFLASSAGGLYAGSAQPPFTERTPPRPLVAYGRTKLAMEERVGRLAARTGARVAIGRLANVYGPGQTLAKPQGLISQMCLADATGRPLPVYVSLDTIRDYLYAPDAGRMVARLVEQVASEPPGAVVVKVLASGRPVTVGHLVGEARRVLRRPLRVIPVSGRGTGQVLDLRLASVVCPEVDALATTTLPTGLSRTAEDVRARVVSVGPLDG